MRLCILKSRASFVLLGLCNNCKYTSKFLLVCSLFELTHEYTLHSL